MNPNLKTNNLYDNDDETIDLRKLFSYFWINIHWFAISATLMIAGAFLFNKYSAKTYSTSTTVLIEDNAKDSPWTRAASAGMDLTTGFGMFPSLQNFENQTIILKSYSQIRRTIEALDFYVSYFQKERFITREIYNNSPFMVVFDKSHLQPIGVEFELEIDNKKSIHLTAKTKKAPAYRYDNDAWDEKYHEFILDKEISSGERIKTSYCDFQIILNESFTPEEIKKKYSFSFCTPDYLTLLYQGKMSIEPITKGSSMISISLNDTDPAKAVDFINKLTSMYLNRSLEKKNEFAENTIRFIDNQLDTISLSLNNAEEALQNFRLQNKVMDLSTHAEQIFQQLQLFENQKMELEMQKKYYQYILSYILENNNDIESVLAPSAMGVEDPLLNRLILEINQLSSEKSSLTNLKKGADFGPLKSLDSRIMNARKSIRENALNLVTGVDISLNELNDRIKGINKTISTLPGSERELFNIKRQFSLTDNLYTYLLERKAEVQIAKASNTPENEVIDAARINTKPIKPKVMINYLIALLIGLIIPASVIAIKEFFNIKIDSPDHVKQITQKPIIGYIPNSDDDTENEVFSIPDSPKAEAFRIIRTKLQFMVKNKSNPVILVTSSIPGEGKSHIAINLAQAYSLTGKRTVLAGFDLRRPQLAQRFKLERNIGVTNYLIGHNSFEEIIQKTKYPNLDIITSGIIPPNPAELIADYKTIEFIDLLKSNYDYVILDSAPVSPVSDSHHLFQYSDVVLFVVRDCYSYRQGLTNSMDEFKSNNIENVCIVMNDIRFNRKRYGYKYGNSIGYGYGYGYFKEKGKRKIS
jgi:capsular exopolysaccharide synthesis family protein